MTLVKMTFHRSWWSPAEQRTPQPTARSTAGRVALCPLPRCSKAESSQTNTKLTPCQQPPTKAVWADPTGKAPRRLAATDNPTACCPRPLPAQWHSPSEPRLQRGDCSPSFPRCPEPPAAPRGGGGDGDGGGGDGGGGGGSSCGSLQPLRSASPPGRSPRRWVPRCSRRGLVQREQMLPGC